MSTLKYPLYSTIHSRTARFIWRKIPSLKPLKFDCWDSNFWVPPSLSWMFLYSTSSSLSVVPRLVTVVASAWVLKLAVVRNWLNCFIQFEAVCMALYIPNWSEEPSSTLTGIMSYELNCWSSIEIQNHQFLRYRQPQLSVDLINSSCSHGKQEDISQSIFRLLWERRGRGHAFPDTPCIMVWSVVEPSTGGFSIEISDISDNFSKSRVLVKEAKSFPYFIGLDSLVNRLVPLPSVPCFAGSCSWAALRCISTLSVLRLSFEAFRLLVSIKLSCVLTPILLCSFQKKFLHCFPLIFDINFLELSASLGILNLWRHILTYYWLLLTHLNRLLSYLLSNYRWYHHNTVII